MQKISFEIAAVALLAGAIACNKEISGGTSTGDKDCITVQASSCIVGSDAKVSLGPLYEDASGKHYPLYWNESETANLSEFLDKARSQDKASSAFQRDAADMSRASFSFTLDSGTGTGSFDYIAIVPQSAARTTGTAAAKKNRASFALPPDTPQKPSSDGPDPASCILMACDLGHSSRGKTLNLKFEPQLACQRMTIRNFPALEGGEKVSQLKIQAPEGKQLSGRLWYNYSTGEYAEYEGSMANYVLVDLSELELNSVSFDVWFNSMPVELSSGDRLTLTASTSSGRTLSTSVVLGSPLSLRRGTVSAFSVDWNKCLDRTLVFDFSSWPAGWPEKLVNGSSYKYGDYSFVHYGYTSGSPSTNRCTHKGTVPDFMVLNGLGFLSLPVLENHKLVKAVVTHSAAKASTRQGGIAYGIKTLAENVDFVTANAKSTSLWNVSPGTEVELPLLTSKSGHGYYLCCSAAGLGISRIELNYEYDAGPDMSHLDDAMCIGTLNVWQPSARTSKKEEGTAPAQREWEYARYNVRDIIKDSGFDILAVQEATLRVRNDLKTDLNSYGRYNYQYFLHKPGDPDHSSSVGFLYDKNRFTVGDTRHFWLSDTPDVPGSQYQKESSVRSAGAAVFTDKKTGRRYFVMVAHASLDDDCNALDGELLLQRARQYNTENLPCIVLGDMNANWNMPLYRSLSSWMDDARFSVELSEDESLVPGTFNGSAGTLESLSSRANRMDFVFTRGISVYSYRVNRDRYKAGDTMQYPSDHCPVIVKCY